MLSGRSAQRHARGRKTKNARKKDAETTAMVESEMRGGSGWCTTQGIWRSEIELKLQKPRILLTDRLVVVDYLM